MLTEDDGEEPPMTIAATPDDGTIRRRIRTFRKKHLLTSPMIGKPRSCDTRFILGSGISLQHKFHSFTSIALYCKVKLYYV